MYYPTNAGVYTPILFIPGFNGVVYPSFYTTAISKFASYGYVVAAIDLYWPASAAELKEGFGGVVREGLGGKDLGKSNANKTFDLIQWVSPALRETLIFTKGSSISCAFEHSVGVKFMLWKIMWCFILQSMGCTNRRILHIYVKNAPEIKIIINHLGIIGSLPFRSEIGKNWRALLVVFYVRS